MFIELRKLLRVSLAPLLTLSLTLVLVACGSTKEKPQADEQPVAAVSAATGAVADPYAAHKVDVSAATQQRFDAGLKLIDNKDWPRAKAQFEALRKDEPKLAGPLVNLAVIARAQNEHTQAQALLKQAITLNKYNWDAYLLLGLELREAGDFKGAASAYDNALALWPDNEQMHLNAGILHDLYLGEPAAASAHYQAYLKLHPGEDKWVKAWAADVERRAGGKGGAQ